MQSNFPNFAGHVPSSGPEDAEICIIGEAAGSREAEKGVPFIGPAGDELNRWLERAGISRSLCRIGNVISAHPPNDWLVGAPWEEAALKHYRPQLDALLAEPHKVFLTVGGTALRAVMGVEKSKKRKEEDGGVKVQDFHGSPMKHGEAWVVPTFHPSFLMRGNQKLLKTVIFDLEVAKECAAGQWSYDTPELVIDPEISWFKKWCEVVLAGEAWLVVDIETPYKGKISDEGKLEEDESYEILYVNFSCDRGQGVTVPWVSPFKEAATALMEKSKTLIFWNALYDVPRLMKAGVEIHWSNVWDYMDAWHVLHSSTLKGLGFVAPFYSRAGAWKHLGNLDGTYRAMDGVQTFRCAEGIYKDLHSTGLWNVFERHHHQLDHLVLRPAEEVGLFVPRAGMEGFKKLMKEECERREGELAGMVPVEALVLDGPYVRAPNFPDVVEKGEAGEVRVCSTCFQREVTAKHKCKGWKCGACETISVKKSKPSCCLTPTLAKMTPSLSLQQEGVIRYFKRLPFNPRSNDQVAAYAKIKKHKLGRNRKTGGETTDNKTLERLVKTGDPFYSTLLKYRQAKKMESTYATSILEKLDGGDRLHGRFIHNTSTLRLASRSPNLQNLASHVGYADAFRSCVRAAEGAVLISADFSGIEAVLTGWFMGDPGYIRLAKLGLHAWLCSHLIGSPVDLSLPDAALKTALLTIKRDKTLEKEYKAAKQCDLGTAYGLGAFGMAQTYPEIFPKIAGAERVQNILFEQCPKLKQWHRFLQKKAHEQGFLGGPEPYPKGHPFGYRHEFNAVLTYKREGSGWKEFLGPDAKKVIAFYPQSSAGGTLYEAALRLFSDADVSSSFFGKTPLRTLIHDEMLLEVEEGKKEMVMEKLVREMTAPIKQLPIPSEWEMGEYLTLEVEVKLGRNWGGYDAELNPGGMKVLVEGIGTEGDNGKREDDEEAEV
jgi:uracil-DNA glycosylase family 4